MKYFSVLFAAILFFSCTPTNSTSIQSPDKKISVEFKINENDEITYSVNYNNSEIIQPSRLGFDIQDFAQLGKNMEISSIENSNHKSTWQTVYGERAEIEDNYNLSIISLTEKVEPFREMNINFRVYNEGVAFNYSFLSQSNTDSITIKNELSEFVFTDNFEGWASDRAQSEITKRKIDSFEKPVERPLLIEAGGNFVALGEAKLVDFARMKFMSGKQKNSLTAELIGDVQVKLPHTTPWRTIMLGKSPGEILENNFIYENLNDECAIDGVSWIKPGKIIREVTLTTQGGKACVDFAATNGLQFIEFDAGWYGHEYEDSSDASTITVDSKRSPGPLELLEIIEYAKTKNIGVILYVNRRALEKQLDEILPLYKSWGIAGVKYGFVRVGPQEWTRWLHQAVKKAAENNLMVDIHDEYRPTGFSRTYPNLMTQEGIRGDEESPTNEHTLKTLFTRMIAGAGDNTNCYYAPRVQEKMGGNVSQLAKAVMLYSPWQFLYWYDRPQGSPGKKGGAGSSDGFILNHPELEFFKNMPTVWDESKVIEGKIGEYATIVRKKGGDWFLGSLTGENGQSLKLNTNFLDQKENYLATIYSYDPKSESSTKVKIETTEINSESALEFKIEKNSGLAIQFEKL